jgi:hypothetical protein
MPFMAAGNSRESAELENLVRVPSVSLGIDSRKYSGQRGDAPASESGHAL